MNRRDRRKKINHKDHKERKEIEKSMSEVVSYQRSAFSIQLKYKIKGTSDE